MFFSLKFTIFFRIAQEYSNDTIAADQIQTVEIEQGMNFMNLENDWEELENYEDEVKGEMRVRGKQLKNIAFDIDVGSDFFLMILIFGL